MTVIKFPLNGAFIRQLHKNNTVILRIFNTKKDAPKSVLHSVIQIRNYLR